MYYQFKLLIGVSSELPAVTRGGVWFLLWDNDCKIFKKKLGLGVWEILVSDAYNYRARIPCIMGLCCLIMI